MAQISVNKPKQKLISRQAVSFSPFSHHLPLFPLHLLSLLPLPPFPFPPPYRLMLPTCSNSSQRSPRPQLLHGLNHPTPQPMPFTTMALGCPPMPAVWLLLSLLLLKPLLRSWNGWASYGSQIPLGVLPFTKYPNPTAASIHVVTIVVLTMSPCLTRIPCPICKTFSCTCLAPQFSLN